MLSAAGKIAYHKNFRADNSNYGQKARTICKQSCPTYAWHAFIHAAYRLVSSFSLSLSSRSLGSLCTICGTHRLAKIRWPAILRLYYTHLQNKNTRNELIMFCPQILILMWITSLRISHAFLKCFLASVILIKKESFFMQTCRENKIKN